jgi:hypothetical protein
MNSLPEGVYTVLRLLEASIIAVPGVLLRRVRVPAQITAEQLHVRLRNLDRTFSTGHPRRLMDARSDRD